MFKEITGSLRLCDLVSLGGALRICDMEMVLLDAKGPKTSVDTRAVNEAVLCSVETDFDFRGRFILPPDWGMLAYIHDMPEDGWCHGMPIESDMAFTVLPDNSREFLFRKGSRISAVLIPFERLRETLSGLLPLGADASASQLGAFRLSDKAAGAALRSDFDLVRQKLTQKYLTTDVSTIPDVDVDALMEKHLQAALTASAQDRPQCSRGQRTHYLIVQRVEQYMRANLRHDIYNNDMCAAAGVSERTLRYAFDDMMHISPNRYLSMLRLCTACRSLCVSDASRRSVKSVALSCGLWDLSRFAHNYRRVFDELPRDTLMREPSLDIAVNG